MMIVTIASMNCGLETVESLKICVVTINRRMNVLFFVNTLINRGHRPTEMGCEQSVASLFGSIATRSGIWIREKTKILRNVVGGGRVLESNGDVRMDNALISGGHSMATGTVLMLRTNTFC